MNLNYLIVFLSLTSIWLNVDASWWSSVSDWLKFHNDENLSDEMACKDKSFRSKSREFIKEEAHKVAEIVEDVACRAENMAKRSYEYAEKVGAKEPVKKVASKAEQVVGGASKMAHSAMYSIDNLLSNITDSLKNVAFDFANCSNDTSDHYTCKRCQRIKIGMLGIDDDLCITLTYVPNKISLAVRVELGATELYSSAYSILNPPPICFVPKGFDKIASLCLLFDNLKVCTETKRLTGSVKLKTTLLTKPISKTYIKDLGSFSLGP